MRSFFALPLFVCIIANTCFCATDNFGKAQEYYKNAREKEIGAIAYYARKAVQEEPNNPQAYFLLGVGIAWSAFRVDNPEGDEGLKAFEQWQRTQYFNGLDTIKMGLNYKPENGAELCWWISSIYSWMNEGNMALKDSERVYLKTGAYTYPNSAFSDECLFAYGDNDGYVQRYPQGKHYREAYFARGDNSPAKNIELINEYYSKHVDTNNIGQEDQYLIYKRAGLYELLNKNNEAISDYEKFLKIWGETSPTSFEVFVSMAKIHEESNNRGKALEMYKRAVDVYDKYISNLYKNKPASGKRFLRIAVSARNKINELER